MVFNKEKVSLWTPPKVDFMKAAHQSQMVEAHRQLGFESTADNMQYCGYQNPSEDFQRTHRCDVRYCRYCRHRPVSKYFKKLMTLHNNGRQFNLMTLGVAVSAEQDGGSVKSACDLRSRLLNLAPFKKVEGALCSIEISWKNVMFFTHIHVLYTGSLSDSRGKSPREKIQAWQRKHFSHDHYDDRPVGRTCKDLSDTLSYLYKGYKENEFPLDAVQSYVEAPKSSVLVTPRGCFRG